MPNQRNIDSVANLNDKVRRAKALVLTDYRGLTHKQLESLHKTLRKVDAEYVVVKNTLLKIAGRGSGFDLENTAFPGPTAALLAYGDEITPIKELYKFIKNFQLPAVSRGFIGNTTYDSAQIAAISTLPSKEILQGQVVSRLSGPMYGLVHTLNGNLQKLVYVLGNIGKLA